MRVAIGFIILFFLFISIVRDGRGQGRCRRYQGRIVGWLRLGGDVDEGELF